MPKTGIWHSASYNVPRNWGYVNVWVSARYWNGRAYTYSGWVRLDSSGNCLVV